MKNKTVFCIYVLLIFCIPSIVLCSCRSVTKQQEQYRTDGITKLETGDYQGAIESFEKALDGPNKIVGSFQTDVLKYRAEAEYMSEDYAAAAHTYNILLQVDKKTAEDYFLCSMSLSMQVLKQQGSTDVLYEARDSYNNGLAVASSKRDIEEMPGEELAMFLLGEAYENSGMPQEAEKLYKQALVNADKKRAASIYNCLGMCKMSSKEFDDAINYFEQGVIVDEQGDAPKLWFNRAVAYEFNGNFDKARELFIEYIDRFGSDEEVERELTFLKTR